MVKAETREYILGERNATRDEFILSRERSGNTEYVNVSLPDCEEPIYQLWTKAPKKHKPATKAVGEVDIARPKHTGGKRPYIMLMQDQDDVINKLTDPAVALLLKIMAGGFVEWDTGRIMDRRSKKSLTIETICARYKKKPAATKAIIKELTKNEVVQYVRKDRAYFLCPKFAKKGAGKRED